MVQRIKRRHETRRKARQDSRSAFENYESRVTLVVPAAQSNQRLVF